MGRGDAMTAARLEVCQIVSKMTHILGLLAASVGLMRLRRHAGRRLASWPDGSIICLENQSHNR